MNTSTIEILPNEILSEIFESCVEQDLDMESRLENSSHSKDYPSVTLDTTKAPWALSHVSSRWRSLAILSPGLWTSFDINWSKRHYDRRHLPSIETRLALQLERCGDKPLSISWYQGSCPKSVLRILCSKAKQWNNVTLRTRRSGFDWLFDLRVQYPNITNLHLSFEIDEGNWDWMSHPQEVYGLFYGMFRNASNLRRLTLSGDYEVMPRIVPELPWGQLTHFTGKDIETGGSITDSFFGVLPLLENIEICCLDVPWMYQTPSSSFTLSRLHTLILPHNHRHELLTNVLVAPALKSLNFFGESALDSSFHSLLHLIRRSSCHITHLSFDDIERAHLETGVFLEFLRAEQLGSVTTLQITWKKLMVPPVLRAFHFPGPHATSTDDKNRTLVVLPHLQSLVITDEVEAPSLIALPSSKLVDMLASRRTISVAVSRLESLTIRGKANSFQLKDAEAVTRFEQLQRDGLSYSRIVYTL